MGNTNLTMNASTGVPFDTAQRLTLSFLKRHGAGLDDLLRRFPSVPTESIRQTLGSGVVANASTVELRLALEKACDELLSLNDQDFRPLPGDAGRRTNVDAGLRWYAARFTDLAKAVQRM